MKKRYVVRLTPDERDRLEALVHKGRAAAHKRRHAELLLLVNQGEDGPGQIDRAAAERVGVSRHTVENLRQRCVLEGLDAALERRKSSRERSRALDGEGEAQLLALVCGEPAAGPRPMDPAPAARRVEGAGSGGLGEMPQRPRNTRAMAIHHRGRAHQIAQPLSKII